MKKKIWAALVALSLGLVAAIVPSVAVSATPGDNPNSAEYWQAQYSNAVSCYKYDPPSTVNEHGYLADDGKAVVLNEFNQSWPGDRWEVLIVKSGSEGGDGAGNAVYPLPVAGQSYYGPLNGGGQQGTVSHWIVCKGSTPVQATAAANLVFTPPTCTTGQRVAQGTIVNANWSGGLVITGNTYSQFIVAAEGFTFPADLPGVYNNGKQLSISGTLLPPDTSLCPTNSCPAELDGGTASNLNLNGWNPNYDTRPAGHAEFVEGGLHIYTDTDAAGSPDPRKVSWAKAVSFPLSNSGTFDVDYTNNGAFPYGPGINLFVDFDANGTVDGTLVFEEVYGQDLWLTNGSAQFVKDNAPVNGGGNGSQWHGTIDQWLTKFPAAQVQGIAFALGSGVNADGVLHSLTIGCAQYNFDYVAPPEPYSGSDVTTDVDCETETFTTTTTPFEVTWVVADGKWTEVKTYGEPTSVERPATAAELNEADCPAPEPPAVTPTSSVKESFSCDVELVTITTTLVTNTWVYDEATRTYSEGEDDVTVTVSYREKTDTEKAVCDIVPPALVPGVLAFTGSEGSFLPWGVGIGLLLLGGVAFVIFKRESAKKTLK